MKEFCHILIRAFHFPAAALFLSVLLPEMICSCSLIYEYDTCGDEFTVRSDWRDAPDATPEGMAYMFFAVSTRDVWRYDFPGREGGAVPLPNGEYSVLSFNDDCAATVISDPDCGYGNMAASVCPARLYESLGADPIRLAMSVWPLALTSYGAGR